MILDLNNSIDLTKAKTYFAKLIESGAKIELKKIPEKRTLKQNSYLHKLFTLYGGEYGWTVDEAKVIIKRELGYTYQKDGEWFVLHTSGMDTKELTVFIDRFRNRS